MNPINAQSAKVLSEFYNEEIECLKKLLNFIEQQATLGNHYILTIGEIPKKVSEELNKRNFFINEFIYSPNPAMESRHIECLTIVSWFDENGINEALNNLKPGKPNTYYNFSSGNFYSGISYLELDLKNK